MLGGDFCQTLPVIKGASRNVIVAASIAESRLWDHFRVYFLLENMRLQKPEMTDEEKAECRSFSQWLLNIGDGNLGADDLEDLDNTSWIHIPDFHCFQPGNNGVEQLIEFIYDSESLRAPAGTTFQDKAIVCPKNETADTINKKILRRLSTPFEFYISIDDAIPLGNDGGTTELLYPADYLNSLNFPGFPPHSLVVKIGVPIMLIRNLNLIGGLCNGTRMIVTQLLSRVIEAKIITGTQIGEKVFLPRILLAIKEDKMPFVFKRKQSPIKLFYAMTINKSQGQSLARIGVYLPEPIFGHGQLYVAMSRATSPQGLKIVIDPQTQQPPNTTKNIVYMDSLKKK